ncbi:MAG: hypothetical protein II187_06965, partial [Treponema sp.]|nr:hypothetical protein [Treponema sp.]
MQTAGRQDVAVHVRRQNHACRFPAFVLLFSAGACTGICPELLRVCPARRELVEHSFQFFENRDCRYFPCHDGLSALNCLFCYCPLYARVPCPGNPQFIRKDDG